MEQNYGSDIIAELKAIILIMRRCIENVVEDLRYAISLLLEKLKNQSNWYRFQPQHKLLAGHIGYRINMAFSSPLAHVCFTEVGCGELLSV